jgi:hypothetical protein
MMSERTELEWTYEPTNYFEVLYRYSAAEYGLLVDEGRVLATLTTPTVPVSDHLEQAVKGMIDSIFLVRQLQIHRPYTLQGPRTYQHSAGRKNVSIRLVGVAAVFIAGQADIIVQNAAGEVVCDSRSERIEGHKALLDSVAPKVVRSPLLRSLLESYSRSIADPDNELVHLYEVRDSLCSHFGDEKLARKALGIAKTEWQRLGDLANVQPLAQGRHRGKHPGGRRTATTAELEDARTLVRGWILSFATTI